MLIINVVLIEIIPETTVHIIEYRRREKENETL